MASTQTILTDEVLMTKEDLEQFLNSLPIKPNENSKATMLNTLQTLNSKTYYETLAGIVPLKLLSQALVSEDSWAYEMKVTRAGNRLLRVEVEELDTDGLPLNNYTLAVLASQLITEITSEVNKRLNELNQLLQQNICNVSSPLLIQRLANIRKPLLSKISTMWTEELPKMLQETKAKYKTILDDISLDTLEDSFKQLNNYLQDLNDNTLYQVTTVISSCSILSKYDNIDEAMRQCLSEAFEKETELSVKVQMLYDNLVGNYLTKKMCTEVTPKMFQNISLSTILQRLQNTRITAHKNFFKKVEKRLHKQCDTYYTNLSQKKSCGELMSNSKDIMNLLSVLLHVLWTWYVTPNWESEEVERHLSFVPTTVEEFLLNLAEFEVEYAKQFIPSTFEWLLQNFKSLVQYATVAGLISASAMAVYQEGPYLLQNWSKPLK